MALVAGSVTGLTALGSLAIGLAAGAPILRALSLGFYAVGCLAMLVGFGFGTQNPFRGLPERRGPEHYRESRVLAALLIVGGLGLILIGVAFDSRVHAR